MRLETIVVLPVFFALAALPIAAAEPVLRQNFADGNAGGWMALGNGASLETVDGSLHLVYKARAGSLSLAYLPVAALPFGDFRSLRFEVRTDIPMPVAIVLSERKPGGGNYTAVVWSAGDRWQNVVLGAADFAVSDGANDPVDADHKLDAEQIESVAFLDMGQFFSTAASAGNVPFHVEPHDGPHSISVRAFEVSRDPLPAVPSDVVDDFSRAVPAWFSPGGAAFEQKDGALSIRYAQLPEEFVAFLHQTPARDYKGATHLAMDVASDRPAQLVISIAERRSGSQPAARYHCEFFLPGGGRIDHREVSLAAFELDENAAPDPDGKLDPNNIQSILILDVTGESGDNTLTLRDLRLIRR
jgi:hypothetical protein